MGVFLCECGGILAWLLAIVSSELMCMECRVPWHGLALHGIHWLSGYGIHWVWLLTWLLAWLWYVALAAKTMTTKLASRCEIDPMFHKTSTQGKSIHSAAKAIHKACARPGSTTMRRQRRRYT